MVGCGPSVAPCWRRSSPRSRRHIRSSISSSSLETLHARAKQPRSSRHTLHPADVRPVVATWLIQPKKRVLNGPKPWLAVRPSGCQRLECDLDWDAVRRRVEEAVGAQAGWTSFIDTVEEELIDAFLIALDVGDAFRGRSQGQKLVRQHAKALGATSFHVAVIKCGLGAESHAFASTSSLFDND